MRIIQLTAENVKKLKVVDITPRGPLVQVTSKKNGQGKTSVLDSIWWALGGEKNVQGVPIRRGAENGRIRLDLGDLIVERRFLASGSSPITVRNAAGAAPGTPDKKLPAYNSPQEILNALIGRLSFDPLAFSRMKPKEQYDALKSISQIEIDLDLLKSQGESDFKLRTDINREAKAKRAQAEGIRLPEIPDVPVDENDLLNQMQSAADHNASIERLKAKRQEMQQSAKSMRLESTRLSARAGEALDRAAGRMAELRDEIERVRIEGERLAQGFEMEASAALKGALHFEGQLASSSEIPSPVDTIGLRASLESAKVINSRIAQRERRSAIEAEAAVLEKRALDITKRMESREASIVDALKAAKMPVEGLGFGDGFVTYNGLPFNQSSDAEQLRVSAEIAMNENPTLRVIRIRDGSLLDDDNLALLGRMASEKDYQIWVEQVDKSGTVGIVMEDGEVVSDNQADGATA